MIILQGPGMSVIASPDVAARLLKCESLKLRVIADPLDEMAEAERNMSMLERGVCSV